MSYSSDSKLCNNLDNKLDVIANKLNNNLLETIKKVIYPFVEEMNHSQEQYDAVSVILKQLPDYQRLIKENMDLKTQLASKEIELIGVRAMYPDYVKRKESIKLTIKEKNNCSDDEIEIIHPIKKEPEIIVVKDEVDTELYLNKFTFKPLSICKTYLYLDLPELLHLGLLPPS